MIKSKATMVHRYYRPFFRSLRCLNDDGFAIVGGGAARRIFEQDNALLMDGDIDVYVDGPASIDKLLGHFPKLNSILVPDPLFDGVFVADRYPKVFDFTVESNLFPGEKKSNNRPYQTPAQIITNNCRSSIRDLFDQFALTIYQFATDGLVAYCTGESERHLKERRLVIANEDAILPNTAHHVLKYVERYGFTPDRGVLEKLLSKSVCKNSKNAMFEMTHDY